MPPRKPKFTASEAILLLDGPRHGFAYGMDATPQQLAGYDSVVKRGGERVWSTIGTELKHYVRSNPEIAAIPCVLYVWKGSPSVRINSGGSAGSYDPDTAFWHSAGAKH